MDSLLASLTTLNEIDETISSHRITLFVTNQSQNLRNCKYRCCLQVY